jgi:hypothetical protein
LQNALNPFHRVAALHEIEGFPTPDMVDALPLANSPRMFWRPASCRKRRTLEATYKRYPHAQTKQQLSFITSYSFGWRLFAA